VKKLWIALGILGAGLLAGAGTDLFPVLGSMVRVGKQGDGLYLLPTGQLLRPWGQQALISGRPVDLTFDSTKRILAVLNSRSILFMDGSTGVQLAEERCRSTSYMGIVFRPGDRELWASETSRNGPDSILIIGLSETGMPQKTERIALDGHPVPVGIAFSPDGNTAYVALSRNNSLAVFDAGSRELKLEVPVGMAPFGVVASGRRGEVFVSNRAGRRPGPRQNTSASSGSLILADAVTGSSASGSITILNTRDLSTHEIDVGAGPSGLALSPDEGTLAVANSHSDSVSIIDIASLQATESKIPAWPEARSGAQPTSVAFAPDGKTLYVASGGNNAILVLTAEGRRWALAGAVPTGWFPAGVVADREGGLRVVNIKGDGNTADAKGTYNTTRFEGSLLAFAAPMLTRRVAGLREVIAANEPKWAPAEPSPDLTTAGVRHLFLIIKENRTYDQVLGDIPAGNGDPKLVMYSEDVTPNHHALARQFVLLDNFYVGGAVSFDGHHWLMQGYVSDYVERAFGAAPRGYSVDMYDAMAISPTGFFWQGGPRQPKVRIYGEICLPAKWDILAQSATDMLERELLGWTDYWRLYQEGRWQGVVGSRAAVPALQNIIDPHYPHGPLQIPDQIRAAEFLRELAIFDKNGDLPDLCIIKLNNDHTAGTRPGFPTPRAMVADNDLALGRIVDAISKTRYWPESLILAVEDDAQDGLDHVDGHRTVALAAGPSVRRHTVDSNNYTQLSMIRTIQAILGVAPQTSYLKRARPMTSIFAKQADTAPYNALTPKVRLDEMNPPLHALHGNRLWAARKSLEMDFSEVDEAPGDVLNQILWWDSKGYATPYPKLR
jgi:YVTN family beta-propeller protein